MCDQADRKVHTNTRRTEQNRTEHKEWKKRKKERNDNSIVCQHCSGFVQGCQLLKQTRHQ